MNKVIGNWIKSGEYDIKTGEALYKSKRFVYVIFMCHLAVEKMLKAIVAHKTKKTPPRTHDLFYLVKLSSLDVPKTYIPTLMHLNEASVPTRYPEDIVKLAKAYRSISLPKRNERATEMVKRQSQIKSITKNLVASLKHRGIKVNKLILYGSYVNGTPRPDSDIDVAVISSSFNNKNLLKRQELLGEAIFGLGEPVEAIGYSYKEFVKRVPLSFLFDIVSKGKTVYQE